MRGKTTSRFRLLLMAGDLAGQETALTEEKNFFKSQFMRASSK